jgi:glucose-1-phosphate cytidylyltransferase
MKYYAHHGHKEFILCLGHQAKVVKNYFRNYDECVSMILCWAAEKLSCLIKVTVADNLMTPASIQSWRTLESGEEYLEGEEEFLVNYSDSLTDLPFLNNRAFHHSKVPVFSVSAKLSYHLVSLQKAAIAWFPRFTPSTMVQCINGGFFIFKRRF